MTDLKRLNYFKGFFTTADDWRAEQRYHREKMMLHNRRLHSPGVLRGEAGDRQVPNARIALAENGGGALVSGPAVVCVHVFEKPSG